MQQNEIVKMENMVMSFSGNKVLDNVSFTLKKGELHSLMGANGAGKSTLIKILNGIYLPVAGSIAIEGKQAHIKTPKDAENYGLSFVHQELNVCDDMSVAENIFIGNWAVNALGLYDKKKNSQNARELLATMGVEIDPDILVRRLRTAEKQIIEILKSLTRDAKVIILDEPTSSLNEKEKQNFFRIVDRLKEQGVSIIFISHFLEDVIQLSDRVTVLKDGVNNGTFNRGKYTKEDLITAMMGRKIEGVNQLQLQVDEKAEVALELKNFSSDKKFSNINLQLQKGDIVGVCGLLGAGKTEIARAIYGLDSFDGGELYIFGKKVSAPKPETMIESKVALLTEERKKEGFIPLLSIRENETLSTLKKLRGKLGKIDRRQQEKFAQTAAERMGVKMSGIEQGVGSLSGGNQQKVVLAKCMAIQPSIFILDEPTRGIDVYAKSEIYKILREVAQGGTGILIFSSELEELLENCRKIIVLKQGKIVSTVDSAQTTKNDLLGMIS